MLDYSIVFDDENMNQYIEDLKSPISQMMLSIMKDYNHNDSKLFRYLPYRISQTNLTEEETDFLDLFFHTKGGEVILLGP